MESHPLIGDREPLASLGAEYAAGSLVFRQKIAKLGAAYGAIRRTRGDGNCFFRWGGGAGQPFYFLRPLWVLIPVRGL